MHVLNTNLNAGFELDEMEGHTSSDLDQALFEHVQAGQAPELKKNVEIVQLVNKFDDLNYLEQDIRRSRGMTRSFAMEAQVLLSDFINERRTLGFFTEMPTRTQYEHTLEMIQAEKTRIACQIESLKAS